MMNIPPSEAKRMDLWTYEAMLWNWNDAHDTEVEPPDPERTVALLDRINADPRLTH